MLSRTFSEEVMLLSIQKLKECIIIPEEVIFNQKDNDDNSIYFIESGKVELYFERKINGQVHTQRI